MMQALFKFRSEDRQIKQTRDILRKSRASVCSNSKAVAISLMFVICSFISCAFDPHEPELHSLGGNYYASIDLNAQNDGVTIRYTKDNIFYQTVASNCRGIYIDSNQIYFSSIPFEGDTSNITYFMIKDNHDNELKKIDRSSFDISVRRLKRVSINRPLK